MKERGLVVNTDGLMTVVYQGTKYALLSEGALATSSDQKDLTAIKFLTAKLALVSGDLIKPKLSVETLHALANALPLEVQFTIDDTYEPAPITEVPDVHKEDKEEGDKLNEGSQTALSLEQANAALKVVDDWIVGKIAGGPPWSGIAEELKKLLTDVNK